MIFHLPKKEKDHSYAYSLLLSDLASSKEELDSAYSTFDFVVDQDLIDSTIYRLNAAQMKYKFLLNKIKNIKDSYTAV